MNVLEKILEEIEEYEKKKCSGESLSAFESGINRGGLEAKNIVRSHMDESRDINVHNNDGWISVEDRLPEEGEKCIITDKYGYVHDGIIYDYAYDKDKNPSFHRWDDEYWQCFRPDVIAWQPLPEPYKPEEG